MHLIKCKAKEKPKIQEVFIMKKFTKKIIAAALAATTLFSAGMAAGSAGLTKASPLTLTASATDSENRVTVDGVTYEIYDGRITDVSVKNNASLGDYEIPSNVGGIAVNSIGEGAFADTGITTLTVPDSIKEIDCNAFSHCGLEKVVFNATDCIVNRSCFEVPDGLTNYEAFYGNPHLTTFVFGDKVRKIPANVCANISSLEKVEFKGKVSKIGDSAFALCPALKNIELGTVVNIENYAFYKCTLLENIDLSSASEIGKSAFESCPNITSVSLPEALTIGERAFISTGITALTIHEKTRAIGSQAFSDCDLHSVTFNAAECLVKRACFTDPDDNGSIGSEAFYGNPYLTDFIFGEDVDVIPENVCTSLTSLKTVEFKAEVKEIGRSAFYGCTSLKDIYFPGSKSEWKEVIINDYNQSLDKAVIHFHENPLNDISLSYKSTAKLDSESKPADCSIEYKSSDIKIASVDANGNITATGAGTATITRTVTDADGNVVAKDTCKVTVSYTFIQWLIRIFLFGFIWY